MKRISILILGTWLVLLSFMPAGAGNLTTNEFFYKPGAGARGVNEKNAFELGLDRVDTRLAKEVWVGDPLCGAALQTAITAIGSTATILRVPAGTHSIAADLTIPVNVTLRPERGAVFAIATTKTLTINGTLDAGLYQIFSCTGTGKVVFGYKLSVFPEWWGAVGDNSTDDRVSIQASLDCLTNGAGGALIFSGKTYKVNSWSSATPGYGRPMLIVNGPQSGAYKTVQIKGRDGATITSSLLPGAEAAEGSIFSLNYQLEDVEISDLTFSHTHGITAKESNAITCATASEFQIKYPKITNCRFKNFSRSIDLQGCDAPVVEKCTFTYDLGRDSGQSSALPCVGITVYVSGRNAKILNNHFDGCLAASVAGNTTKSAMDGLVFGITKNILVEGNTIVNFGYEGIFVQPASDATHKYSAIIQGNFLDAAVVPGSDVLSNYAIRCDESNSLIHGNTIVNATNGIQVQREVGYTTDIYRTKISNNVIQMCPSTINTYSGINVGVNTHDFTITGNDVYWPSYNTNGTNIQGIATAGVDSRIVNNRIKADAITSPKPLYGIWINNNCSGIFIDGNETVNCDYGVYLSTAGGGPQGLIEMVRHTFTGNTVKVSGNIDWLLWRYQRMDFTPTAGNVGYYRILTKSGQMAGRLSIQTDLLYDNAHTDVVAEFDVGGYGNKGCINEFRYMKYNAGVISKIRTGDDGGSNCYLDIYVSTATTPQPISVFLDDNKQRGLVLADPPAFNPATPSNIVELTCAAGLVTQQ